MLKVPQSGLIMAKGSKMCGLYISDGSTPIDRASLVSEDSLHENKI